MKSQTFYQTLGQRLKFWPPKGAALTVQALELAVDTLDGNIIRCFLTFCVDPVLYRQIEAEALFHLEPEARGPIYGGHLQPEIAVEIEAKLDPAFIFSIAMQIRSIEALAAYLQVLSESQTEVPLLKTESWFALYIKQSVPVPSDIGPGSLKVGYRTTWADAGDER